MKRFTLLILLCLLGGMVAAQPKYHARYWFDRLDSESVVDSSATGTFHTLLGTQTLAAGMHNLHVMVRDTSGRWSPPQTHLFYRVADTLPTNPLRYTCWYDMDFDARQTGDLSSGGFLLNAVGLSHGMHNLHIMVQDINGRYFAPQNAIFYRVADTLPTHPMRYTCWFDNDFDQHQSGDVVSGNVLLNTTSCLLPCARHCCQPDDHLRFLV